MGKNQKRRLRKTPKSEPGKSPPGDSNLNEGMGSSPKSSPPKETHTYQQWCEGELTWTCKDVGRLVDIILDPKVLELQTHGVEFVVEHEDARFNAAFVHNFRVHDQKWMPARIIAFRRAEDATNLPFRPEADGLRQKLKDAGTDALWFVQTIDGHEIWYDFTKWPYRRNGMEYLTVQAACFYFENCDESENESVQNALDHELKPFLADDDEDPIVSEFLNHISWEAAPESTPSSNLQVPTPSWADMSIGDEELEMHDICNVYHSNWDDVEVQQINAHPSEQPQGDHPVVTVQLDKLLKENEKPINAEPPGDAPVVISLNQWLQKTPQKAKCKRNRKKNEIKRQGEVDWDRPASCKAGSRC